MKLIKSTPPMEHMFQVELSETELRALGFAIVNVPLDDLGRVVPKGKSAYQFSLDLKHTIDKILES